MQPPPPVSHRHAGSRLVFMAIMLVAVVGSIVNPVLAATAGKTITIGESNSDVEKQELLGYFGADPDDKVKVVTVEETQKAIAKILPDYPFDTAYSSTSLTCRELGDGVDVTTINISRVTPAMYAMALVTAGVGDADLIVASPNGKQAEGLTALAGVFQSWKSNPCASSNTSRARQDVALRQIALAFEMGPLIGTEASFAGDFIINVQRVVVIEGATSSEAVDAAVAGQEAVFGFTLPQEQRDKLVALMVDLQELEIDWSTFSAGWTIEFGAGSVSMRGEGVAIANAQASATAQAAKEDRAEARAEKAATQTAVAEAEQSAAASAQQTAEAGLEQTAVAVEQTAQAGVTSAEQTRTANDDASATARAQPSATEPATPSPTPEPEPVAAAGKITAVTAPNLSVEVAGQATEYRVMDAATITRDGKSVQILDLRSGDAVELKVVPETNQVVGIVATAPEASSPLAAFSKLLLAIPLLALIPVGIVLRGKSFGDPFIVKRVSH